jgi:hypothetical protein
MVAPRRYLRLMVARGILIGLVAACCAAPAADARTLQEIYASGGDPWVVVSNDFDRLIDVRRCPDGVAPCESLVPAQPLEPGETAAGTVFEFEYDDGQVLRTSPWLGRATSVTPPTLSGSATVGGTVRGVAGTWSGGWEPEVLSSGVTFGDFSKLTLVACSAPAGGECWVLGQDGAKDTPLSERWAGWYLHVAEARHGRDTVFALPGLTYPHRISPFPSRGVEAHSAPVQIPAAPPAPIAAVVTPKPPTVTLRSRALRTKGRISVGRVTCAVPCRVTVKVSGGGKKAYTTTFVATGLKAITAPVRRGKLTVRVTVDGNLVKSGRMVAR